MATEWKKIIPGKLDVPSGWLGDFDALRAAISKMKTDADDQ